MAAEAPCARFTGMPCAASPIRTARRVCQLGRRGRAASFWHRTSPRAISAGAAARPPAAAPWPLMREAASAHAAACSTAGMGSCQPAYACRRSCRAAAPEPCPGEPAATRSAGAEARAAAAAGESAGREANQKAESRSGTRAKRRPADSVSKASDSGRRLARAPRPSSAFEMALGGSTPEKETSPVSAAAVAGPKAHRRTTE
eukprot:scaffold5362_cov100-Isochrysis_galbana.AAC.1